MFKNMIVVVLGVQLLFSPQVFAAGPICPLDLSSCEETLAKTIRSKINHYWCYARSLKWPGSLASVSKAEGIITGDPHLGNFAVVPLLSRAGRLKMTFANIDFDDAGQGPFALDFLRLVIATKAIERDIRNKYEDVDDFTGVKEMFEAYNVGLLGRDIEIPKEIEKDLAISVKEYQEMLSRLVDGRLSGSDKNKLSLKNDEVEARRPNDIIDKKIVLKYLPSGFKVLDIVRVKKKRGGSVNEDRFWVLIEDASLNKRIFEFKGWSASSLEAFQKQAEPLVWAQSLYPVFWPGHSSILYDFRKIRGQYFWVREKRKPLTDIPYQSRSKKDLKFLTQMSAYVAHHIGLIHGRQKSAQFYVKELQDESKASTFREAIKSFMKEYFEKFKGIADR